MAQQEPWWEGYFDERFIALYEPLLPPEQTEAEVAAVVELTGAEPGSAVLDLACGWGRHAVELAGLGMRVTGVDRSAALLRRARADAAAAGVEVCWVEADAREIDFDGEFDVVVSLFSSLGYFLSDEQDLRVLRAARRALRPGGLLVLETMHRDQVAREYAARDWWETEDGTRVWVEREFDAVAGVSHERLWWRRGGEEGEKAHSIRVRSATEWAALLEQAELEPIGWYGGWEGEPVSVDADRLVMLARPA